MFTGQRGPDSRTLEIERQASKWADYNMEQQGLKQEAAGYEARHIANEIAVSMVSDMDHLKKVLKLAAITYQNNLKGKFFRRTGHQRAQTLITKIDNAKNAEAVLRATEEALTGSSFNDDSLRTTLYGMILTNYPPLSLKPDWSEWFLEDFGEYYDLRFRMMINHAKTLVSNNNENDVQERLAL